MFFLDVTGPEGGRTLAFPTAELSIGSGSDCDLQLDAPGVARHHASLIQRDGHAVLLDLGTSTIAIDGQRVVETALLVEGCIVTIGPFQMRFREVELPPDTIQTMTLRQPSAPPIPMSLRDIEILSGTPSTSDVRSSELVVEGVEDAEKNAETDPSIPVAEPLPPDDANESEGGGMKTPLRGRSGLSLRAPPSSLRASEDPIEVEFLRAIDEDPDVETARMIYADWLEERGDNVRADYVRTLGKVVSPAGDPYTRDRLRFLSARISSPWRARLLPRATPIERCGAPHGAPVAAHCPRTWGALDRITVDDVRRCTVCSTFVHFAPDVRTAVKWGHRPVVVDLGEERQSDDLVRSTGPLSFSIRGRRTSRVELARGGGPASSDDAQATVTAFYLECAQLESLAVTAFAHLYEELTVHGAPVSLRRRALEAAAEETQHVRIMEALAGCANPWLPGFDAGASTLPRTAFEVALENAVEGCVRETYGALVARHHADRAPAGSAGAMETIAIDEDAHATLSWDIARWIEPRLSPAERRRLVAAREAAVQQLLDEAATPVEPALVALAGCPDAAVAVAFGRAVGRRVAEFDARESMPD